MSEKFKKIYDKSINNPEKFWQEVSNDIFWFKKPTKILNKSNPPFYKWFEDGTTNTCYNALDLHVDNGRGDKTALIYDSPITGNKKKFSYSELKEKVSKFAGSLDNLGIKKSDRVLDCACGAGYGSKLLIDRASKVIGVDISNEAISFAKVNCPRSISEITKSSGLWAFECKQQKNNTKKSIVLENLINTAFNQKIHQDPLLLKVEQ